MTRNLSIRKKIILGFIIILLPVIGIGLNNMFAHKKIERIFVDLGQAHQVQILLQNVVSNVVRMQRDAGQVGYLSVMEDDNPVLLQIEHIRRELALLNEIDETAVTLKQKLIAVLDDFEVQYTEMQHTHESFLKERHTFLDVMADDIQKHLKDIKTKALLVQSQEILVFADKVLQDFFLSKVLVMQFLQEPSTDRSKSVVKSLRRLNKSVGGMKRTATNAEMQELVKGAYNDIKAYQKLFKGFSKTILKRKSFVHNVFPDLENKFSQNMVDYVAYKQAENEAVVTAQDQERQRLVVMSNFLAVAMIILGLVLAIVIGTRISARILQLVVGTRRLADGDYEVELPIFQSQDELTEMVKTLEVLKKNAIEKHGLEQNQRIEQEKRIKMARRKECAINDFDMQIATIISNVETAAGNVQHLSGRLAEIIEVSAREAALVSAEVQDTKKTMQVISDSSRQMSISIDGISDNITHTAQTAGVCADATRNCSDQLDELQDAVNDINSVVQDINEVAEQTNLLALNAMIESARAGDAGKGFAVVANEVKALANQTHLMTDEISKKVDHTQKTASQAISVAGDIMRQIQEVSSQTTNITSAVEEQNKSTEEISINIQEVAVGAERVASNTVSIQKATNKSADSIDEFKQASYQLATQSDMLKQCVREFLNKVDDID